MTATLETPWGTAHDTERLMPGIDRVTTPRHGGYHLTPTYQAVIRDLFPSFRPFAGPGWYEEDQDWSIVALAFPSLFDMPAIRGAVRTVMLSAAHDAQQGRRTAWADIKAWLESPEGQPILAAVQAWERNHADLWELGSYTGPLKDGTSFACLTRIGDGQAWSGRLKIDRTKQFYTDADFPA